MADGPESKGGSALLSRAELEAHFARVRGLQAAGNAGEAEALVHRAVERAAQLRAEGEIEQARLVLTIIVESFPGHLGATHDLGALLAESDDEAAAEPLLRAAWTMAPEQTQLQRSLARLLLRRGDLAAVAAMAAAQLARFPGDSFALALAAFVAVENGDSEASATLLDFERLVRFSRPGPPPGYPDIAAFNRHLTETLLDRPDLTHNPADRTTHGGRQSGPLFPAKEAPLAALANLIRTAVADYGAALPGQPGHPFLGQRPGRLKLHGWATVLNRGGYQQPHIHPSGWLSGVYYPCLPGIAEASPGERAGWLVFGEPSSAFYPKAKHPHTAVAPVEGGIVLFPSYLHHRTEPFAGTLPRVSVAFDLMAAK